MLLYTGQLISLFNKQYACYSYNMITLFISQASCETRKENHLGISYFIIFIIKHNQNERYKFSIVHQFMDLYTDKVCS